MGRNEAKNAAARSAKTKTVSVFGHPIPAWAVKAFAILLAIEIAFGTWPSTLANSLAFAEDDAERVEAVGAVDVDEPDVEGTPSASTAGYAGTLADSSENYNVKVEFTEAAGIAEGSSLSVKEYSEDSAEYHDAFQLVYGVEYGTDEADGLGMDAIDISLVDPDGEEFEPAAEVSVSIERSSLPEGVMSAEALSVDHLDESLGDVEAVTVAGESVPGDITVVDDAMIAEFDVEAFSTFTVKWTSYTSYNYPYNRSAKVHYVDENGNELKVSNTVLPEELNSWSSSPAFLIYDIDNYEYSYTYLKSNSNRIPPILDKDGGYWYYINGNRWSDLKNNDDIYVVYKKKPEVTQGGTPTLKPVNPGDYPGEPSILKESKSNGDGTANLSLSITGHTKDREVEKLADVIVVFDISGSMEDSMSGSTRLQVAKSAVNRLADTLAEKKNSNDDPLIRMSLISFSTTAEQEIGLTGLTTSGVRDFKRAVNNLSADGGTNWDYALQLANQQEVDSGRATFVIFVTDGDPTYRKTRGDVSDEDIDVRTTGTYSRYRQYGVYGNGSNDDDHRNYGAAVTQGQAIVGANKNLYTIGISDEVTIVQDFNEAVGGQGAVTAENTEQLNEAFEDIAASIGATMGVSDIQMTDGITEMTQTVEKSGLTGTDGTFKYWKKAKGSNSFVEWDPASEGCAEAEYDTASGAVKWNMGTSFMPEDGATYKVTWKVWPSQDAYDILAKCENDPSYYDTLTDAQKAQIVRTDSAPNSYTLKTNEPGAGTTYKSATKSPSGITTEGDIKTLPFNEVNPLGMSSDTISIQKIWDNGLDPDEHNAGENPIVFKVMAGDAEFDSITLGADTSWRVDNYNISCGLMTTTGGKQVVYEKGHDFSIVEPAELSYHWDFKSDVYRPMVINNQTVMLVKVDNQTESNYTIDGSYYKVADGGAVLKATNERRSNLNISKTVVAADKTTEITPDDQFTINATITESKGEDVWFSIQDANGDTIKDSSLVTGEGVQYQETDGYFHCPSGTALTLKIQAGWNYRFINLHPGSTYIVEEVDPSGGPGGSYFFHKLDTAASHGGTPAKKTGRKAEGTIDKSNNSYSVAYANKKTAVDLTVEKKIDGAMADMTKQFNFEATYTVDGETKTETFSLGHNEKQVITGLPVGTKVTVKETNAEGYVTTYEVTIGTATATAAAGPDDHSAIVTLRADATLVFTNTMEPVVISGVKAVVKSPISHILVIAVLVAAACVAITRSRREQWNE